MHRVGYILRPVGKELSTLVSLTITGFYLLKSPSHHFASLPQKDMHHNGSECFNRLFRNFLQGPDTIVCTAGNYRPKPFQEQYVPCKTHAVYASFSGHSSKDAMYSGTGHVIKASSTSDGKGTVKCEATDQKNRTQNIHC